MDKDEFLSDFIEDSKQKKQLAYQSRYKKHGGKSKKCSLSTDYMTRKQWLERCGKIMTYSLNEPISWKEFCILPTHIQEQYLINLRDNYNVTAAEICGMFDIGRSTFYTHCKKHGVRVEFTYGKKMSAHEKALFDIFCRKNSNEPISQDNAEICSPQPDNIAASVPHPVLTQLSTAQSPDNNSAPLTKRMDMTEFSMTFQGSFDRDTLFNSIIALIPTGTPINMEIKCRIESHFSQTDSDLN